MAHVARRYSKNAGMWEAYFDFRFMDNNLILFQVDMQLCFWANYANTFFHE